MNKTYVWLILFILWNIPFGITCYYIGSYFKGQKFIEKALFFDAGKMKEIGCNKYAFVFHNQVFDIRG